MTQTDWERQFEQRFRFLRRRGPRPDKNVALSIKVRVTSGCFHREHSPSAYQLIDNALENEELHDTGIQFEEHESGPELLLWLAVTTGALSLAKSVLDLIVAIVKARQEGIRRGDSRDAPLEIIVRGTDCSHQYKEKTVLTIGSRDQLQRRELEREIDLAIQKLYGQDLVES